MEVVGWRAEDDDLQAGIGVRHVHDVGELLVRRACHPTRQYSRLSVNTIAHSFFYIRVWERVVVLRHNMAISSCEVHHDFLYGLRLLLTISIAL
jgi:hypothetical protein